MMEYEVQRRNRKTIGLSIERDGALIVKAPFLFHVRRLKRLSKEKKIGFIVNGKK